MTKDETLGLIFLIKRLYPGRSGFENMGKDELAATAKAWGAVLSDIDFGKAQSALVRHASLSEFPPSIAEIRGQVVELERPKNAITGDEAWEIVLAGVKKYGYTRKEEAFNSMPEAVRPMAKRWYKEICITEMDVLGVTRGQFLKAWEIHADREKTMNQLPASMRTLIGGMTELKRLEGGTL